MLTSSSSLIMLNASVRVVNGIVPPLPNGIGPWVPRSWPLRREHPSWSLGTMRNRCRPKGWVLALVPLLRREPAGVPVWLSSRHDRWLFDPCGGGEGGRRLVGTFGYQSFGRSVLSCIEADVCKQRFILQYFLKIDNSGTFLYRSKLKNCHPLSLHPRARFF